MAAQDDAIRSTNDDAALCKRCAVALGYWSDPYLQYFVKSSDRKPPEINRGYYTRVSVIQNLLGQFIDITGQQCQVVNLGAGYDTSYWTLTDAGRTPKTWVEVDFAAVTNAKIHYIKMRKQLSEKLTAPEYERNVLHSSDYHIVNADLRVASELIAALDSCSIDRALPTAFITECVLVYMPSKDSTSLLRTLAETFNTAFFINYEQVDMSDNFSQVMVENLKARGCGLPGVDHCASMDTQKDRFMSTGWQGCDSMNIMDVYRSLPQADVQRIERIEMLDDYENLSQLFEHYCVVWAYKDALKLGLESISLTKR